jgi:transcriptional regulator with XRE-family HTH domain
MGVSNAQVLSGGCRAGPRLVLPFFSYEARHFCKHYDIPVTGVNTQFANFFGSQYSAAVRKRARKPVPDREVQICRRLREVRELLRLTQKEFAAEVGIKPERLASYEQGRAPLRFDLALRICRQFIISEKWLATGKGDRRLGMDLTGEGAALHVPADASFGKAYDDYLVHPYEAIYQQQGDKLRINLKPADRETYYRNLLLMLLDKWRSRLTSEEMAILFTGLVGTGAAIMAAGIREGKLPAFMRPRDENGIAGSGAGLEKKMLTEAATSGKLPSVKSQLDNLLAALNRLTRKSGKKTELARFLGAPLASVSRWLSGEREPGGETTLKMLNWVRQQERK